MKNLFPAILVSIGGFFGSVAVAQDSQSVVIIKEAGMAPKVNANGVDLMGASNVYKLLGETYLVLAPETGMRTGQTNVARRHIKLPPGTRPPIIPTCQCPEDYIVKLEQRISTMDVETLFRPQAQALGN